MVSDIDEQALAQAAESFDVTPQAIAIAVEGWDTVSETHPLGERGEALGSLLEMNANRACSMVLEYFWYLNAHHARITPVRGVADSNHTGVTWHHDA